MSNEGKYFVSYGISDGTSWATYARRKSGRGMRRVCSKALPLRSTKEEAERDLAAWLKKKFHGQEDPESLFQVIDHLNQAIGTDFRPEATQARYVASRLKEGYSVDELKAVIDLKVSQWGKNELMQRYLRPSTLFNREKFEAYHQEVRREALMRRSSRGHSPRAPHAQGESADWENEPDSL